MAFNYKRSAKVATAKPLTSFLSSLTATGVPDSDLAAAEKPGNPAQLRQRIGRWWFSSDKILQLLNWKKYKTWSGTVHRAVRRFGQLPLHEIYPCTRVRNSMQELVSHNIMVDKRLAGARLAAD